MTKQNIKAMFAKYTDKQISDRVYQDMATLASELTEAQLRHIVKESVLRSQQQKRIYDITIAGQPFRQYQVGDKVIPLGKLPWGCRGGRVGSNEYYENHPRLRGKWTTHISEYHKDGKYYFYARIYNDDNADADWLLIYEGPTWPTIISGDTNFSRGKIAKTTLYGETTINGTPIWMVPAIWMAIEKKEKVAKLVENLRRQNAAKKIQRLWKQKLYEPNFYLTTKTFKAKKTHFFT
jgi:hypothetical protein